MQKAEINENVDILGKFEVVHLADDFKWELFKYRGIGIAIRVSLMKQILKLVSWSEAIPNHKMVDLRQIFELKANIKTNLEMKF